MNALTTTVEMNTLFDEQMAWTVKMQQAGVRIDITTANDLAFDTPTFLRASLNGINGAVISSFDDFPKIIMGHLFINNHHISNFQQAPTVIIGRLSLHSNKLESLKDIHKHIHEINGHLNLANNPIRSHVLGLLLIKGLTKVLLDNTQVAEILNRYLGKGRVGMLMAQEELIEAGLEEFAQL
jgi:hypothetical protein